MPTNVLDRLQRKTDKVSQREARLAQETARLKNEVRAARTAMMRAAGLFDLDPARLQKKLLFLKSVDDLITEGNLDAEAIYRELVEIVSRKKLRRDSPQLVSAAE
jgi:phage gp16-like protein